MNLTITQKEELIELLSSVDVKQLEIEGPSEEDVKWFRFGSYNGLQIAIELVKSVKEQNEKVS